MQTRIDDSQRHDRAIRRLFARHGLVWADTADLAISRVPRGRGFSYRDAGGEPVRDPAMRDRFDGLAIPPAWRDVRIAAREACHLQAIGLDAAGRIQRRYHPAWDDVRSVDKFFRLRRFARALPAIRRQVARDLARPGLDEAQLCAIAVRLIDRGHLRPGNEASLAQHETRGATTLSVSDLRLADTRVRLEFVGKSGQAIRVDIDDRLLARRLARLKDRCDGQLFVLDDGGRHSRIGAARLNAYIATIGHAAVSAKDFRTFDATATALWRLLHEPRPASRRATQALLASIARDVSARLHNTPTVARNSYIHPSVVDAWLADALDREALCRCRGGPLLSAPESALSRWLSKDGIRWAIR
ncbi:MAG: DNA topoisomerase IB [Lautropia sp.]